MKTKGTKRNRLVLCAFILLYINSVSSSPKKNLSHVAANKVAMNGESNIGQLESRPPYEPDHNASFNSEGSKRTLKIEDRTKYKATSSLCLTLKSPPASQTMTPKQHAVARNPRRSACKNKLGSGSNRSCKVTRPSNKHVSSAHDVNTTQQLNMDSIVIPGRRPGQGAHNGSSSLHVDQDGYRGSVMAVDDFNHVNRRDCRNTHIP